MQRRRFLQILSFLSSAYASAKGRLILARDKAALSRKLTYEQIRKNLSGTRIYIVPYAHSDWAWVHTRQWQADRDNLIFNEALDILRRHPEYRWFLDTQNEELQTFIHRSPERVAEFQKRVQEGKIGISGGTICNQHPHWMEGESFIWNLALGRRYFEQHFPHANLEAMTLYDVCVGYTQAPQLLAKAGYKYYRFWRPGEALNAKGIPRQFRWEGLDGTSIICSHGTYGGLVSKEDILANFAEDWEKAVENFYERVLAPILNVPTHGFVWIANGSDDARPLRVYFPEDPSGPVLPLIPFVQTWNEREKIPLRFATPAEFFKDLSSYPESAPLIKGVLDPCGWTYWYGLNGVNGLRMWRTLADDTLVSAQKFLAISTQFGEPYPERAFEKLWRSLLTTSSHAQNWLFEEDYQAQLDLVKGVVAEAAALETEGLQRLAGRIRVQNSAETLVVFNPFPWERRDVVKLHPTFVTSDAENIEVRDSQGRLVPSQAEEINHYDDEAFIKEANVWAEIRVPAMGYTTVYLEKKPQSSERQRASSNENLELGPKEFQVRLNSSGIPTLIDSSLGASYAHAGEIVYQEVHDTGPLHYGSIIRELSLQNARLALLESGPIRWVGEVSGDLGPHNLRLRIEVYPSRRRVAYQAEIESRGGNGYFLAVVTLPFAGKINAGIPFGVEPRNLATEPYVGIERLRPNVFYAGHWVDIHDGAHGLTWVGRKGEKGYIYEPESRRLGHYLLQTIEHAPKGWERFCNHYMEGKGRHVFAYYLISHAGTWREANIPRAALEAEYGLRAVSRNRRLPENQQILPEEQSFLECTPHHVFVSSLAQSDQKWILRLFEGHGQPGNVRLQLPRSFSNAREIDLNGRPLAKSISLEGKYASFNIAPWEIVTLELT